MSDVYILVKWLLEKLHLHPKWGPKTHEDQDEPGAARKVVHPSLYRKPILETIKSVSLSDYIKKKLSPMDGFN